MKLNINGYAQHGKDTVADMFVVFHKLRKISASMIYAEEIMKDGCLGTYKSVEDCYKDRVNHRAEWYNFIREKSKSNPTYYVAKTLDGGDIYVGHRGLSEYQNTKHLFDATIWVDASRRGLPPEDKSSCNLSPTTPHDFYIDNGGAMYETQKQVESVFQLINNRKRAQNAYQQK